VSICLTTLRIASTVSAGSCQKSTSRSLEFGPLFNDPAQSFEVLLRERRHLTREPNASLRRFEIRAVGKIRGSRGPRHVVNLSGHDDHARTITADDRTAGNYPGKRCPGLVIVGQHVEAISEKAL